MPEKKRKMQLNPNPIKVVPQAVRDAWKPKGDMSEAYRQVFHARIAAITKEAIEFRLVTREEASKLLRKVAKEVGENGR